MLLRPPLPTPQAQQHQVPPLPKRSSLQGLCTHSFFCLKRFTPRSLPGGPALPWEHLFLRSVDLKWHHPPYPTAPSLPIIPPCLILFHSIYHHLDSSCLFCLLFLASQTKWEWPLREKASSFPCSSLNSSIWKGWEEALNQNLHNELLMLF